MNEQNKPTETEAMQPQPEQPADTLARIAELEAELSQMKDRWLRS